MGTDKVSSYTFAGKMQSVASFLFPNPFQLRTLNLPFACICDGSSFIYFLTGAGVTAGYPPSRLSLMGYAVIYYLCVRFPPYSPSKFFISLGYFQPISPPCD